MLSKEGCPVRWWERSCFPSLQKVDTKISACQVCKRRLLQFATAVNCHEVHKEHTGKEMNE